MKFRLLYADPPWAYENWTKSKNGAASSQYDTHATTDIQSWPIGDLADKDSLLFLWATLPKLPDALAALEAWGFEFVTVPFVWVKQNRVAQDRPYCGVGFWTRGGAEVVILGRRGKGLKRQTQSIRQVFSAPVLGHSAKPPEVRDRILELVGDVAPRIELFSRNPEIEGWTHTGLEADGLDIVEAVPYYTCA